MDDFKRVTVKHLRELARKYLGCGYSKLSKNELLGALAGRVPGLKTLARLSRHKLQEWFPSKRSEAQTPPRGPARPPPPRPAPEKAPERVARTPTPAPVPEGAFKPAQVVNFPRRVKSPRTVEEEPAGPGAEGGSPQHAAEPLGEGFFVARVQGEAEARRHHLTEAQAPRAVGGNLGYEENLGELPVDYGDDLAVVLARDPSTLFVTWNFSAITRSRALEGLDQPRALLRLFEGDKLVREEEFALESRSFYLYGLPPGHSYRVEAHFVGRDGRSRRLSQGSQRIALPPEGPSADTSVRFMHMPPPPQHPVLGSATGPLRPPAPEGASAGEREYITWRRVPLPGSQEAALVPEVRRERVPAGVPVQEGAPSGPYLEVSRPPLGSSEQNLELARYLEGSRPAGSSEQPLERVPLREVPPPPAGPPGQRAELAQYLEGFRPAGSSEQPLERVWSLETSHPKAPFGQSQELAQYLESFRPVGSSEQRQELARYLASFRSVGSSEQNLELAQYLESLRPAGSSEQSLDFSRHPEGAAAQRADLEKYLAAFSRRHEGSSEHLTGGTAPGSSSDWRPSPSGRGR
ncbi:DUF4912 domain-containing protein [Stigmatella erecta]|uniref:Uncharacterized conserved protein n=1 Tax=Stigmatella erecta TaxID=83460 RepID=A0A1I0L1S2_9BACT|nr:DUF4912 domain-containing protein [Stigmatella erecta]SEU33333.1 Uncharacterized conserved protein [Stigmatella erecta]